MITPEGLAAMRFGYGPVAGRFPALPPVAQLDGPDLMALAFPGIDATTADTLQRELRQARRARRMADESETETDADAAMDAEVMDAEDMDAEDGAARDMGAGSDVSVAQRHLRGAYLAAVRREFARAVGSETPYRERLVRFWANHFTVRARAARFRPLVSVHLDEAIRPHVTGRFDEMLRAAVLHPTMLRYLDQIQSVGPGSPFGMQRDRGLNENLARELLELHTVGVASGYSQGDVTGLARLLTGVVVGGDGTTLFRRRRAEPGAHVVLGQRYGGDRPARLADIHAALDDLAARPETARHLARKLAVHFVADDPVPALVDDLAGVWTASGGDLQAVATALAQHPAAAAPDLHKARQPFDFLVAALRALGIGADEINGWDNRTTRRVLLAPIARMGQPWQQPPGPDGWAEEADRWITPQGLAARIDWAMTTPARLRRPLPDPRDFVDMALAGVADPSLRRVVAAAENTAEGIGLVLAAPAFNRR